MPIKKNTNPIKIPFVSILTCSNSTKEISIIIPAENPIIKEINFGLGFFIANAIKLPTVVDKPANKLNKKANKKISKF
jgi:ribosomal protein S2